MESKDKPTIIAQSRHLELDDEVTDSSTLAASDQVLNQHGVEATHEDCLDYDDPNAGDCSGHMVWYESATGSRMLRCEHHADIGYARQDRIRAGYWQ